MSQISDSSTIACLAVPGARLGTGAQGVDVAMAEVSGRQLPGVWPTPPSNNGASAGVAKRPKCLNTAPILGSGGDGEGSGGLGGHAVAQVLRPASAAALRITASMGATPSGLRGSGLLALQLGAAAEGNDSHDVALRNDAARCPGPRQSQPFDDGVPKRTALPECLLTGSASFSVGCCIGTPLADASSDTCSDACTTDAEPAAAGCGTTTAAEGGTARVPPKPLSRSASSSSHITPTEDALACVEVCAIGRSGNGAGAVDGSWAAMPDDLLKRVLAHLHPSYLRVSRLVCRSWEEAAGRFVRTLRPECIQPHPASLAARFPSLVALDLSNCMTEVHCHKANELWLRSALHDGLLAALAGLSRLQDLSLKGTAVSGPGLVHVATLPRLRKLSFVRCASLTDAGLGVLGRCSGLLSLNLRGCEGVTDAGIAALHALPALRQLLLSGCCQLTDGALVAAACMTTLQRLSVDHCPFVSDAGIAALAGLPHLRHLGLSCCVGVGNAGVAALAGGCGLLETLDVSCCPKVDMTALRQLGQLSSLKMLTLGGNSKLAGLGRADVRAIFADRAREIYLHIRLYNGDQVVVPGAAMLGL